MCVKYMMEIWTHGKQTKTWVQCFSLSTLEDHVVNEGFINFIPRDGDIKGLHNLQPITFLIVIHMIFTKTLRIRVQPILNDVISPYQTAFLFLRFILHNIVAIQESLQWAKIFRQHLVLWSEFEDDCFFKAYDKVSCRLF